MVSRIECAKNKSIRLRITALILPVSIFLTVFFVLFSMGGMEPLVHDEAVYLTKARLWQEGTPADEFRIYRPIGMPILGRAFLQFSQSEDDVRIFGVFFGALSAVFLYLLFEKISGQVVGIITTAIVVSSSLFLQNAPQFLNDIPSSGLLLGSLLVIWNWYETKGESNSIYLFALFSAAAFYLRYGVSSTLVVLALVSFYFLVKNSVENNGLKYGKLLDTFILSFILFSPHFIESFIETNNVFGILSRSGDAAGREYLGKGLLDYIRWLPNEIGGWLLGVSSIIGVVSIIVLLFNKNLRTKYLSLSWLGAVGLLSFVLTGTLVHAEPRYVFFPVTIFVGTGVSVVFLLFSRMKASKFLLFAFYAVCIISFGYANYKESVLSFRDKTFGSFRTSYVTASTVIDRDIEKGSGCAIWSSEYRPELSWYSKCHTLSIVDRETFKKDFLINFRRNHYSVVFSNLKERQINEDTAKEWGISLEEIFRAKASETTGYIIVYRIDDEDKLRFESDVERE